MIENYLNVTELPEVDLKTTNRLLVIDNENQLQSLNKDVITQIPSFIFSGSKGSGAQDIYTAIKENNPINVRYKTSYNKKSYPYSCEYLLPVGLDASTDPVVIRFEHIHQTQKNPYATLPQTFERKEVSLQTDGRYTVADLSASSIGGPLLVMKGESNTCKFGKGDNNWSIYYAISTGAPVQITWKEDSTELNSKTIYFNSFENLNASVGFTAYGIDGDKLYIAKVTNRMRSYTLETKQLNFTE